MTQNTGAAAPAGTGPAGAQTASINPPVPFDPDLAAALATFPPMPTPFTADHIGGLRTNADAMVSDLALDREGTYTVTERQVPGPAGAPDITLLICSPMSLQAATAAIYHTHGGGMVCGNSRNGMDLMLELASAHSMVVVSVEYRLAPEHPDPAPVEDCYAGLVWTAEHADELGIDPERIVIAGGSAGGGLAAGTALLARDRGGPALSGQMLLAPMLDDRNDTPSSLQMAGLGIWDRAANQVGWEALLGDRQGGAEVSVYAAPARATDLSALPSTFIDVGSAETFRDEAVAYAGALWRAGVQAELHVWPGGFHGYDAVVPQAAVSRETNQSRREWLHRHLAV